MTDEDDWQRAIDRDRSLLGVFADWLDDRGDPRAEGYRWMHTHAKRPNHWQGEYESWDWSQGTAWGHGPRITPVLMDRMPASVVGPSSPYHDNFYKAMREYYTRREADDALAFDALALAYAALLAEGVVA